jgi:glutamate carboxypeptidase
MDASSAVPFTARSLALSGDGIAQAMAAPDRQALDGASIEEAVHAAFESEQVPFLASLVEQSSCSREPEDVERCFEILDARAIAAGLSVEVVPDPSGRQAAHRVYATAGVGPSDRALALVGHLDTVFPRAMGFHGFRREGDVARGPGVLDMKSGLTSVIFALEALRRTDPDARPKARFVVVSDEEIGSPSSRALFERLAPHTDAALVFEAGRKEDRIVTRRKGGGLYAIEARGFAAHAGNRYFDGTNAIVALALALPKVEALSSSVTGTTVSVGLIEGGTAKNTVAERAIAHLDARYTTMSEVEKLEAAVRAICADPFRGEDDTLAPERLRRAVLTLAGGVTRPPMEPLAGTDALRSAYEKEASAVGLAIGEAPLQGGGSDANLLAAFGVPCIDGLGPYGEHFHETREWCSLGSLEKRTAALGRFLRSRA